MIRSVAGQLVYAKDVASRKAFQTFYMRVTHKARYQECNVDVKDVKDVKEFM